MKKFWVKNSYTILLILVSLISTIFLSIQSEEQEENFYKVTVKSGDTIWEYAEQYSIDSNLSKKQFINWVIAKNELSEKHLYPGDELILPIEKVADETNRELASAIGE